MSVRARTTSSAGASLREVIRDARAMGSRELLDGLLRGFREHALLIEGGAIAFRCFLALLTGTVAVIGLLGFFDLSELWRQDVAPDLEDGVSPPAFRLIDGAVIQVLTDQQLTWATVGAALAVWQGSNVVRAAGQVLNRIYGMEDRRTLRDEVGSSLWVSAAVGGLLLGAVAAVTSARRATARTCRARPRSARPAARRRSRRCRPPAAALP